MDFLGPVPDVRGKGRSPDMGDVRATASLYGQRRQPPNTHHGGACVTLNPMDVSCHFDAWTSGASHDKPHTGIHARASLRLHCSVASGLNRQRILARLRNL